MSALADDLRFAMRGFWRHRGLTGLALLVLAVGSGANTAIFSVVDAVVLRPLPYAAPEQLVTVGRGAQPGRPGRGTASWPSFFDWRTRSRTVGDMVAYHGGVVTLTGTEATAPELLPVIASTANLFRLLGVAPALGRGFLAGEDEPGRPRVVVLSDGLWRRRFGGDPAAVGRVITLDGAPHTVVGVAAPGFSFPPTEHAGQAWVPVPQGNLDVDRTTRSLGRLQVLGRLAAGATPAAAVAELASLQRDLARQHPEEAVGGVLTSRVLQDELVRNVRPALLTLLLAVGAVLLIACANVGNLLLARAAARGRELAVRAALGAGRGRLIRQLLTESACLGLLGAAAGLALAVWALDLLVALLPPSVPRPHAIGLDGRVLLFTAGAAILTSVGCGLAPALSVSTGGAAGALALAGRTTVGVGAGRGRGRGRGRMGSALLVGQIAISFLLLVAAGLALRSFARVTAVDPGFEVRNLVAGTVALPGSRYQGGLAITGFYRGLLERVRALPGVAGAALVMPLPFSASSINLPFVVPGGSDDRGDRARPATAQSRFVTPGYFSLMGIPVLRGRELEAADDSATAAPVAIISESLARRHFPGEDPLGKRLEVTVGFPGPRVIVGVVRDVRRRLDEDVGPALYLPFHQPTAQIPLPIRSLLVRAPQPGAVVPALRAQLAALDGGLPLGEVRLMEELLSQSLQQRRLAAALLGMFAAVALLLAAAGVYGVMSHAVTQRTRELGLRMALGARQGALLGMILGQGLRLCLLGLALGVAGALALTRVLQSQLYGVSASDPATFAGMSAGMLLVAGLASLLPAVRATRVHPMIALRQD